MFMVLDNCEYFFDVCVVLVVELLGVCLELMILVISWELIGMVGEIIWCVLLMLIIDEVVELFVD